MRIDLTRNDIRHIKTVSLVLLRKCDVYLLYRQFCCRMKFFDNLPNNEQIICVCRLFTYFLEIYYLNLLNEIINTLPVHLY